MQIRIFSSFQTKSVVVGRDGESRVKFNRNEKRINDVIIDIYNKINDAVIVEPEKMDDVVLIAGTHHMDMLARIIELFNKHGLKTEDLVVKFSDSDDIERLQLFATYGKGWKLPPLETLLVKLTK